MRTVIIIPTLRERDNLVKLIPAILGVLPECHILVADDHSQDGTADLISKIKSQNSKVWLLDRQTDHGYGKSILDGLRWALENNYEYIITMDADFSHDPNVLPQLIEKLDSVDLVIGSRYVTGGGVQNWSWYRRLLSRFSNWYVRAVLHTGISDNTTGFTAYRCSAVELLLAFPLYSDGYAFLVEVKNKLKNLRIFEYPIIYTERREGKSKMSFRNIWEAVWLPWRIRYDKLKKN